MPSFVPPSDGAAPGRAQPPRDPDLDAGFLADLIHRFVGRDLHLQFIRGPADTQRCYAQLVGRLARLRKRLRVGDGADADIDTFEVAVVNRFGHSRTPVVSRKPVVHTALTTDP